MVDGMKSRKLGSIAPERFAKPFKTLGIFLAQYQVLSKNLIFCQVGMKAAAGSMFDGPGPYNEL
jgi:hypothetical protein